MINIEVKNTKNMGRGVFATKDFSPGEIIEICPAIPLTPEEIIAIKPTRLENWFFEWKTWEGTALVMGYAMIYNHSNHPNAAYTFDFNKETITFTCIQPIKKGSQIFYNYNQYKTSSDPVSMYHPHTNENVFYYQGKLHDQLPNIATKGK